MNTSTFQRRHAFTLIELLSAIAIIAVLAAILIPAISKMRQGANRSTSINQLRQIGMAINLYAQENNNTYPAPDASATQSGFWARAISRDTEYLGVPTQWLHQGLVAPGVRYPRPGGGFYTSKEIRMTYTATGVMAGSDSAGFPVTTKGRSLGLVQNPSKAPLIFLARQRSNKDGFSNTVVVSASLPQVTGDLAATSPESTVLFNFDLGPMPVLMADGHIEAVSFSQLKDFVKQETWRSVPK